MSARIIDLDAARVARSEATGEPPVVRFGGVDYTLPVELPWAIVEAASSQDSTQIVNAVKSLLGEQWAAFEQTGVSVGDMQTLIENVARVYGADQGN